LYNNSQWSLHDDITVDVEQEISTPIPLSNTLLSNIEFHTMTLLYLKLNCWRTLIFLNTTLDSHPLPCTTSINFLNIFLNSNIHILFYLKLIKIIIVLFIIYNTHKMPNSRGIAEVEGEWLTRHWYRYLC